MVGDMSCPCPLPNGKVLCVWCRSIQPFRRTHRHGCMAGYLCLMPTAFLPLRHNTNLTLTAFLSLATQHKICHPFGVPLMDVCLAGVPCFALHRLPVFFHAFGIILFEMQTELIWKIPTKTCRGKVMKEKLNCVKTKNYFLLHNSNFRHCLSFALRKIRVDRPKGYVSSPQTWSFTQWNLTFRAPKPKLSQIQFL